jgi:phosphoglycolate phosphatase-like HAD superfamily hydrolase
MLAWVKVGENYKMIKAIIFDCFGVLVKSGHNLLRQDFPELSNLVDELQGKSDFGVLTRQEFNQIVAEKTNLTAAPNKLTIVIGELINMISRL